VGHSRDGVWVPVLPSRPEAAPTGGVSACVRGLAGCRSGFGPTAGLGVADFAVSEIAAPVALWHGLEDSFTPPSMGHYLAETLPNCRGRFLPGEGHFLLFPLWRAILTDIVGG
jgi:pimeloyl-ACP methyl ester carboxylesterase